MASWRGIVTLLGGAVVLASAPAHALLGWPPLRSALVAAGADAELVTALAIGWSFGSGAIAAFGLIIIATGVALLRRRGVSVFPALVIAVTYVVFGVAAFVYSDLNVHFLPFVVLGSIIGGAVFGARSTETRPPD